VSFTNSDRQTSKHSDLRPATEILAKECITENYPAFHFGRRSAAQRHLAAASDPDQKRCGVQEGSD
jgi:hypothetical protein